ncbi:hypothetical protein BCT86_13725 [Vibrio breoganii]|uniref:hypothetical protein n=1 Tax=Vibrio breoganii TaxID=553239 RepID=UPI00037BA368|nr:hypothetical protein [Vibrio breoganii]OED84809.1 hypothetical protein A1QE_02355 [Vibrio breoganii ZF-55]PMG80554.1 hypothetical protein BCU83_10985 [Vibrio breoganii]PML05149.1 hypothetical protein BCT86_13725 [Vibrio breoganii]
MSITRVLQHQYAMTKDGGLLSTNSIWICTGFYGWDEANKVAFLCHFDHPLSVSSLPVILREIRRLVSDEHSFEAVLIGGKGWFWSRLTRGNIKALIERQSIVKLSITEKPFRNWLSNTIDVTICSKTGNVSFDKVIGRSAPKGFSWFIKPMQQV